MRAYKYHIFPSIFSAKLYIFGGCGCDDDDDDNVRRLTDGVVGSRFWFSLEFAYYFRMLDRRSVIGICAICTYNI